MIEGTKNVFENVFIIGMVTLVTVVGMGYVQISMDNDEMGTGKKVKENFPSFHYLI